MTERKIQAILDRRFHNHKYKLFNSYVFKDNWESDFFSMSENGYTYEVEIKISRGDYHADFKKYKHQLFDNIRKPHWIMNQGEGKYAVNMKEYNC